MEVTLASVILDVDDLEVATAFWTGLLRVEVVSRYPRFVFLRSQAAGAPSIGLQLVDAPTPGKNRAHIDLRADDLDAASARVEALGGRQVAEHSSGSSVWRVFQDPTGNWFCIAGPH